MARKLIGTFCRFDYPREFVGLEDYSAHRGRVVGVTRRLGPDEADCSGEVETMYEIVDINDGWVGNAFRSELVSLHTGLFIGASHE